MKLSLLLKHLFLSVLIFLICTYQARATVLVENLSPPDLRASCQVIKNRIAFQERRSSEVDELLNKVLKKKRLNHNELSDLEILIYRYQQILTEYQHKDIRLHFSWKPRFNSIAERDYFNENWHTSSKKIQLQGLDWFDGSGYWPEQLQIKYISEHEELQLSFSLNSIDYCFGRRDINFEAGLQNGFTYKFEEKF